MVIRTPVHTGKSVSAAMAVYMAVAADANFVFFKKIQNLRALIVPVFRGIMQKHKPWTVSRAFKGGFKPNDLPEHDFSVVSFTFFFLEKPAPGSANRRFAVKIAIIIKDGNRRNAVFFKKPAGFSGGGPPVVVISL